MFDLDEKKIQRIEGFLKTQINDYLKLEINVSLIESIDLTKTGLFGNIIFFQQSQLKTKDKPKSNVRKLEKKSSIKEPYKRTSTLSFTGSPETYAQSIAIQLKAGIEIFQSLQRQYPEISKDLMKIYFMYIAIKKRYLCDIGHMVPLLMYPYQRRYLQYFRILCFKFRVKQIRKTISISLTYGVEIYTLKFLKHFFSIVTLVEI